MVPTVHFTTAGEGSFALGETAEVLEARRRRVVDRRTIWLTQTHSADVIVADGTRDVRGERADAVVTAETSTALSVITADCAPVLLGSSVAVGAIHAGWRGLRAGVIENAVAEMRGLGAETITAWLGPCIRSRCYEFGSNDLTAMEQRFGPEVRGETAWGTPALDVTAAVRNALASVGITAITDCGVCTACSPEHFSYRAKKDEGRQAAFVWLDEM